MVLGLLGFVSYTVYSNDHKIPGLTSSKATEPTNPYSGWKTYTLKFEKATFRYPPTWQVSDKSEADKTIKSGGLDIVTFTAGNGFQIRIVDGGGPNDFGFSPENTSLVHADKVTFSGQPAYLLSIKNNDDAEGSVAHTILSTSATDYNTALPSAKNVIAPALGEVVQDKFVITLDYNAYAEVNGLPGKPALTPKPLAALLADEDYKKAKLLLESITY
jgi:hypothetical protein